MTSDPAELTAHLGYWLRLVSNHVSQSFASKLGDKNVTVAEWVLLRVLYNREPTLPSQLADDMGMTRGAITKLADRLLTKALIAREPNLKDGRSHTLHLTKRGTNLVPELAALADENEAECFAHLSDTDRSTLQHILKQMVDRLALTAVPID